jgi:ribosomal peptide maturation radical SAM protein 1
MEMHDNIRNILLVAMPFAGTNIPSIQLPLLEGYLKERDIKVQTRHLYLKAAEFYGLNNYNFLISHPNNSYNGQMAFSKYIFPKHWKKTEDKFRKFFNEKIIKNRDFEKFFTFEDYVEKTHNFYNWVIKQVDWKSYDLVGFTLNYGQLLPSLAVAKKIKELNPYIKIIFGGSRTVAQLGIKVLEIFDYLDFIVSGEGEQSLYLLISNYQNYESIPNLIYRRGKEIVWNKSYDSIDLNSLSIPTYDPFFNELSSTSDEVMQYFHIYGKLPIEISRGCWWNKCTFCNLNIQHNEYREKTTENIIREIEFLSNKYNMLDFQMIGNTLPKKDYRYLFENIKALNKDLTLFVESRADQLKSEDYLLMKDAGFTIIQTGIESFSQSYIKKMNKGVSVIDNIASLKFCKENRITNNYNIIVNYPNEEAVDFEETKKNIRLFQQYIDPPQICPLVVEFGSIVYNNPEKFNIEKLEATAIDKIMFPKEILHKGFNFFYSFKKKKYLGENDWDSLIEFWRNERKQLQNEEMIRSTTINKLVFYFVDGGTFLKIYDKRDNNNFQILVLNEVERAIFLSCIDIISYQNLVERFSYIPDYKLAAILHSFEKNGIVFREDDNYLSLPLRYRHIVYQIPKKESRQIIYNSGKKRNL